MKYKDFRNFRITRSCNKQYKDYKSYIEYLAIDFKHRCAYCNMLDRIINENFRIDHFIPQTVAKNNNMESLIYDYNNLVYCCPKCNSTKSSQYAGNIHDGTYNNQLFYNPVDTDYNDIFYRNEYGGISSEDKKGKEMIINLKLFLPTYYFSFLIEEIEYTLKRIDRKLDSACDSIQRKKYQQAYFELNDFLMKIRDLFNCDYYNNSVKNAK